MVRGARQVGKTTLIKDFSQHFKYAILLNLEKPEHRRFFEQFDNVHLIVEALFLAFQIPSKEQGNTLLFIDECFAVKKVSCVQQIYKS
ncbi:AAA family ATPase [Pedobacter sp. Leaf132]|uniref:AAA family ATPase n=1 Tax=Pedobacter sp. Leaf132 TaxID=2876557 RepID=UPI00351D5409